jgi:hypothetical protein
MTNDGWEPGASVRGLAGEYALIERLGDGPGATSWRATREGQGDVVLRVVPLETLGSWRAIEAFEKHARMIASLRHPSIPSFVESFVRGGDTPRPLADLARISGAPVSLVTVRAFAPGRSLERRIADEERHDAASLEAILRGVLDVLEHLHGLLPPVIHGGIQPRNVILDDDTLAVSLVDPAPLGLAGLPSSDARYVAPEQSAGHPEAQSDLYSLALTLLSMATHSPPGDVSFDRRRGTFDVHRAAPGLPPNLAATLVKMLAREPARRPRDVAAVRTSLSRRRRAFPALSVRARVAAASLLGLCAATVGARAAIRRHPLPPIEVAVAAPVYEPEAEPSAPSPREAPVGALAITPSTVGFTASVVENAGAGPAVGTACTVFAEVASSASCALTVRCGNEDLFSMDADGTSTDATCAVDEVSIGPNRWEYELAFFQRDTVAHTGLFLSSRRGVAVVNRADGATRFALSTGSDPRAGVALTTAARVRHDRQRGEAFGVAGPAPVKNGASCEATFSAAKQVDGECDVDVRCAGKRVYSGRTSCQVADGHVDTASDPTVSIFDGSPALELMSSPHVATFADESEHGPWSFQVLFAR